MPFELNDKISDILVSKGDTIVISCINWLNLTQFSGERVWKCVDQRKQPPNCQLQVDSTVEWQDGLLKSEPN